MRHLYSYRPSNGCRISYRETEGQGGNRKKNVLVYTKKQFEARICWKFDRIIEVPVTTICLLWPLSFAQMYLFCRIRCPIICLFSIRLKIIPCISQHVHLGYHKNVIKFYHGRQEVGMHTSSWSSRVVVHMLPTTRGEFKNYQEYSADGVGQKVSVQPKTQFSP